MGKTRKIKIVAGISSVVVIILVIIGVLFKIENDKKSSTITLLIAPQSSAITINGEAYENGEYRVYPGEYSLAVEKEGFASYSETFTLSENETKKVYLALDELDTNGTWYEDHPEDQALLSSILSYQMSVRYGELKDKNPIISELPIRIDYMDGEDHIQYTISYRTEITADGLEKIVLLVKNYAGKGNYERAAAKLEEMGYSLSDYEVEYENLMRFDF